MTDNALEILKERYFLPGETKPEDMFRRVAKHIAQAEKEEDRQEWEDKFYEGMNNLDWLPNSPAMMCCGTHIKCFSACYVIPVKDSMEDIFEAVKQAAVISKSGGGVGFSFSDLRPSGDLVGSTKGISSGPVSFMEPFNAMVGCVKQGSKRRGALMGMLRVDHPDIEEFIEAKKDTTRLTNFNISVAITDEFIEKVNNDQDFELRFGGKVYETIKAKSLWDKIVAGAWESGEPGVVFIDRMNEFNPTPHLGDMNATNPCG